MAATTCSQISFDDFCRTISENILQVQNGIGIMQSDKISLFCEKYPEPSEDVSNEIVAASLSDLVIAAKSGKWSVKLILLVYCWKALKVHSILNCLTEILFDEALELAASLDDLPLSERVGELFGVPVSLKDCVNVAGFPSSVGVVSWSNDLMEENSIVVDQLIAAGAVPFCKTNVPQTMKSFECSNPLWGTTENPIKPGFTPGGSSGGEAALAAAGGSILGIGNDVAGSLRIPAHCCGIYTIKCSRHRISTNGFRSLAPASLIIHPVVGPLARSIDDLVLFYRVCFGHSDSFDVVPCNFGSSEGSFSEIALSSNQRLRYGVIYNHDFLQATPACLRAVKEAETALKAAGHAVVPFQLPFSMDDIVSLVYSAIAADGGIFEPSIVSGEPLEDSISPFLWILGLPHWIVSLFALISRLYQDRRPGIFLRSFRSKSAGEIKQLLGKRNALIILLEKSWREAGIDALIMPPMSSPALPHGSFVHTSAAASYAFIWNIVDFVAGIVPVTTVDSKLDAFSKFTLSQFVEGNVLQSDQALESEIAHVYNEFKMQGLPVGVQIITPRFCEAECLRAMRILDNALKQE